MNRTQPKVALSRHELFKLFLENIELPECWEWKSGKTADHRKDKGDRRLPYGVFYHPEKRRSYSAHRMSWELFYGPIPKGLMVLHKCDNSICVNPRHLYLGTHKDNMADKVRRRRSPYGERNHKSKASGASVRRMRELFFRGVRDIRELMEEYGLARTTVHQILTGRTWKHAGGPIVPQLSITIGSVTFKMTSLAVIAEIKARYVKHTLSGTNSKRALMREFQVGEDVFNKIRDLTWEELYEYAESVAQTPIDKDVYNSIDKELELSNGTYTKLPVK